MPKRPSRKSIRPRSPLAVDCVATLAKALPGEFEFYGMGQVKLQTGLTDDLWSDHAHGIGYALHGDFRGLLVIRVEFAEDLSLFEELGNVLASRLATELGETQSLDVLITPPKRLKPRRLASLLHGMEKDEIARRTYFFFHSGKTIPVDTWIVSQDFASMIAKESDAPETAFDAVDDEIAPGQGTPIGNA